MKKIRLLLLLVIVHHTVKAQSYHALHGNVYGSGLTVYNNPASIVHQPFPWDLTIFSTQQKAFNNVATVKDYGLLGTAKNSYLEFNRGFYGRRAHYQSDIRLFNLRFNIGRDRAVAVGANLRHYLHVRSSPYFFTDTLQNTSQFFNLNQLASVPIGVSAVQSSWGELFFSYAQTLYENELMRLSGGVTLKAQRGLSGGYVRVSNGYFEIRNDGLQPYFVVTEGRGRYGYSSNYDRISSEKSTWQNIKDVMGHTLNSASADLGAELLLRYDGYVRQEDAPPYNWKIGFSILDIGRNQYRHGRESRRFSGFKTEVVDSILQYKFQNVAGVPEFNDSLETIAAGYSGIGGNFIVNQPTRLVVNIDKHVAQDFYVNANISANLRSSTHDEKYAVREMDMIAVTPRWEKRKLAAYLPMQYTTEGKFWMGLAGKLGPVVMGLHNAGWIFTKNAMPNGGFYLALTVRGWKFRERDTGVACPDF